ncbi:MAG: hypothetical protein ACR2K2_09440 [Mycobacteriales bacterium]
MSVAAGLASPMTPDPRRKPDRLAPTRRRTPLQLVPTRRAISSRTPFVAMVVSLLVAGLLGLLMLNTVLARDAFTLYGLKVENRGLTDREQALQREVESLRSPQNLAAQAESLGMVPAGPPAFLRLPDGAVLGVPEAAEVNKPAEAASPAKVRQPKVRR